MGGVGASAAPMNGYPKVFNIESDPHEEHNIGEMYNWVIGPVLKAVEEYKASLVKASKSAGCKHDAVLSGECNCHIPPVQHECLQPNTMPRNSRM